MRLIYSTWIISWIGFWPENTCTVLRQRLTHFNSAQNLKNASIFGVSIFGVPISSRNFLVQKLTVIKVFYEIRQRNHFTGRDRWALGIDRVSELLRKCFWPKIGDFDKAHQKFWNFENFENFQKMRQSLARQSLAKDCTLISDDESRILIWWFI